MAEKEFLQGATIVPRCFWFVDLKKSELGLDENLPPLISSDQAQKDAKPAYKGCVIEGRSESRFLYATLLPMDMVPFGFLRLRTVVLPVRPGKKRIYLYTPQEARAEGFVHLAQWLDNVEAEWVKRRGEKAKGINTSYHQWGM